MEEIKQAAFNNDRESSKENQQYFIEGAMWSDENPNPELKKQWIDKACEWLQKNDSYSKPTELQVMDFRKYMEEEL